MKKKKKEKDPDITKKRNENERLKKIRWTEEHENENVISKWKKDEKKTNE